MAAFCLGSSMRRMVGLVALLLLAGLACNAPLEPAAPEPPANSEPAGIPADNTDAEDAAQPTATATETGEPVVTDAPSATPAASASPMPSATPLPSPTIGATPTRPAATATATPRPRPSATATKGSSGPLDFTYNINWVLSPTDPQLAIATITIFATGGSGNYRYYRDDIEVEGPEFSYEWGACRANPGSLRVDSSDGQSKKIDYFSAPPCPTPTPTP